MSLDTDKRTWRNMHYIKRKEKMECEHKPRPGVGRQSIPQIKGQLCATALTWTSYYTDGSSFAICCTKVVTIRIWLDLRLRIRKASTSYVQSHLQWTPVCDSNKYHDKCQDTTYKTNCTKWGPEKLAAEQCFIGEPQGYKQILQRWKI